MSLTGHHQARHWRESTITDDDLSDRGGVFFAAVEMTRMPMILTNPRLPDNPIVFANKAFLDLTGYEESEVLGRNCRFLQGPRTDRGMVQELREAVAAQQPISIEILNYKRDGSPFWNAVFIGPVTNPQGELLYFFASQLDITRRRESEESYRQAQKMEAVGQLTAGLAHDFNNLLQAIVGNHERLMGKIEAPELRRRLENAQHAAERAAKLTRQLLAFARKTRLEPTPVDLSAAVNSFADLLATTAGNRADLQLNLRHRLPNCFVDLTHLETSLLNIVLNARDAMPDGGTVTVSTSRLHLNGDAAKRELPSGDYVVLSVTDEGTGMPPSVAERAVEPFFTTKGQGKGTGLGLAMVHGFLQQSRGRLEIESEVGRGTTVRMILPVHEGEGEPASVPESLSVPSKSAPATDGATILVVEDNEDIQALAREHLLELGYKVLVASDGEEALSVLGRVEHKIDLLFTDLIMPGSINGLALADELRNVAPQVPVLLTTGYNEELARGANIPGLDVLAKPYRRAELADRVRSALARTGSPTVRRRSSDFGAAEA
ncbi:MAG TPA: histidine kinase famiy protein [Rubellimicrobium sp.]|nr:histidine kinase famiy protein [Rubellimicrobium sp.]